MAPVVHPRRLLKRELAVRDLSANRLALDLGVPSGRGTDIPQRAAWDHPGYRGATRPYFGNRAQFWRNLQSQYEIALVERDRGAEIARRVQPADAAEESCRPAGRAV